MNKFLYCSNSSLKIYKDNSVKSEVVSEMLYGEKFKILKKTKNLLYIKTTYDNYLGYIKKNHFYTEFKPTHKVSVLRSIIFKNPYKKNNKIKKYLPFGSRIKKISENNNFLQFKKNGWIKKKDVKKNNFVEKNLIKIIKYFINVKYVWGGKTFNGIDCSGLLQIFFQFNNKFIPRDTKDQIKFFKKNISGSRLKKNNLIFWKGHVAICINSHYLIHAYGPKKKVLIMNIPKTIKEIEKNAKLKVKGKKKIYELR